MSTANGKVETRTGKVITAVQINFGEIVDGITFLYTDAEIVKLGGIGGGAIAFALKAGEQIIAAAFTKAVSAPYWRNCLSKIVFTTNLGNTFSYEAFLYNSQRDDPHTTKLAAPSGKFINSFKGTSTTIPSQPGQYLTSLEIGELQDL